MYAVPSFSTEDGGNANRRDGSSSGSIVTETRCGDTVHRAGVASSVQDMHYVSGRERDIESSGRPPVKRRGLPPHLVLTSMPLHSALRP